MDTIKMLSTPSVSRSRSSMPLHRVKCNKIASLLRAAKKKVIVDCGCLAGCCHDIAALLVVAAVGILTLWHGAQLCQAAPTSQAAAAANETVWPPMRHYDIWSADLKAVDSSEQPDMLPMQLEPDMVINDIQLQDEYSIQLVENSDWSNQTLTGSSSNKNRQSKVIHLFPVPVDGECLSDDGRRLGNCFNAYECRQKGGTAKGECAMGFGVCCVFVANCNETITNNITYIVSPNFPSFMPSNVTGCSLKVKMLSDDISQLRIDFYHFSLGQPNRRTGVCDGDVFNISGGPSGAFSLCGQNSGQHLYYDVTGRALPRQSPVYGSLRPLSYAQLYGNLTNASGTANAEQLIDINLNFSNRFLPIRLWEIRVAQIPFSQRAPAGCLQYHTGLEGIMQTFNFAENGRHLANQHYRICVRQEREMCSIMYQPCDEQSFRIGGGGGGGGGSSMGAAAGAANLSMRPNAGTGGATIMNAAVGTAATLASSTPAGAQADPAAAVASSSAATTTLVQLLSSTTAASLSSSSATATTAASSTANVAADDAAASSTTAAAAAPPPPMMAATTPAPQPTSTAADEPSSAAPANDEPEGSGDGDDGGFNLFGAATTAAPGVSRRPRPVGGSSGGFDLLGFLRTAFDLRVRRRRRQSRQFYSSCSDRITMPCIIEDFIGTGLGPLPGCEPVHCGAQFCSSGVWPCRIESTVTPFYIGVHFGDGTAGKGSAEENIGACLRYTQVQCM